MAAAYHHIWKRKHSIETNFPSPVEKAVDASFTTALGPGPHIEVKCWCLKSLPITKQCTENARGERSHSVLSEVFLTDVDIPTPEQVLCSR